MRKIILSILIIAFTASSCHNLLNRGIRGNGNIQSRDHPVSAFRNVQISGGNIDLFMVQGDIKPVKIETDQNLLEYIEVEQRGDKIIIKSRDGTSLDPTRKITAFVTAPVYNTIDVSGASTIHGQGKITNTEKMKFQVSGASDMDLDLNAPAISVDISGAGSVTLKGETKVFDIDLTGAGKAHCFDLKSEETKVEISGAGDADVYASVKLHARVSGVGSISYKGGAANVSQDVSGAGTVKKAD